MFWKGGEWNKHMTNSFEWEYMLKSMDTVPSLQERGSLHAAVVSQVLSFCFKASFWGGQILFA